jgi:transcriptional regulator of heat shock response
MLDKRQGEILKVVVKEYAETAIPVGSELLKRKYKLLFSSATIRNEMALLENEGYLVKPHISAGRIPSDKGYRYFVDYLIDEREVSENYQKKLEMELLKSKTKNVRMERTTAKLLSSMSHCLVVSGIVDKDEYFDFGMHNLLDDPEFNSLNDLSKLTSALDLIDENIDKILSQIDEDETKIFIGKENPLKEIQNCSMIVSPYRLKSGEKGLVAVIGPKRMKYQKNKSLVEFMKNVLGDKKIV